MDNPFSIAEISKHDILKISYQMEIHYDGTPDEAIFATRKADQYYSEASKLYPPHEINHFMVYCSFFRDALYHCIQKGNKCKMFIDFNNDFVYCLPEVET